MSAAKLLIARGADVNLTTNSSGPALLGAIARKNGILVKLLLASGANPNAALETKSALYLAAKSGCLECVMALVDFGADVNALNQDRESPYHAAKLIGLRACRYFATHGAVSTKIAPSRHSVLPSPKGQALCHKCCSAPHRVKKASNWVQHLLAVGARRHRLPFSIRTLKPGALRWSSRPEHFPGDRRLWPGVFMNSRGIETENGTSDLLASIRRARATPDGHRRYQA